MLDFNGNSNLLNMKLIYGTAVFGIPIHPIVGNR